MTWLRIDDQIAYAASTITAGNAAMGAWLRMSAWCSAQLADGEVPRAVAQTMASTRELAALVAAGLAEEHGDAYGITGYLLHNPSRAQVLAEREARRAGGRIGAARRWSPTPAPDGSTHGSPHGSSHGTTHGDSHPHVDAPVPARPGPTQERESAAPAASPPLLRLVDGDPKPRPSRRRPETPAPPSTATTEEVTAWCLAWGIPAPTKDTEAAKLIDHARSQDRRCRDWSAAWANWQRRAAEYGRRAPRGPGGQPVDLDAPWLRDPQEPA